LPKALFFTTICISAFGKSYFIANSWQQSSEAWHEKRGKICQRHYLFTTICISAFGKSYFIANSRQQSSEAWHEKRGKIGRRRHFLPLFAFLPAANLTSLPTLGSKALRLGMKSEVK
jgi:hypothetical protein